MCGRFYEFSPAKKIRETFSLAGIDLTIEPNYNIAPGQKVVAIVNQGQREAIHLRWGLIPVWAKDEKIGYKLINARSETAADKPSFRSAFKSRRCLIVADGFYEWQKSGSAKRPFAFTLPDTQPFAMAGLYENWQNPAGEQIATCTVLTTSPNELVAAIHDRMPVILTPQAQEIWLDPEVNDREYLEPLLIPYSASSMLSYPVAPEVNSPQNNHPGLIEPLIA